MRMTIDDAILRIAERTTENRQELKRTRFQRRTEFTDLYGVPFTAQGDANTPATFYISVSPDLVYFLRFQFKLIIQPFRSSVSGASSSGGTIGGTELDINPYIEAGTSTAVIGTDGVEDNPHTHSSSGGTGGVNYGVKTINTSSEDFAISIDGIDITDFLIEQQNGDWIYGEGIYPTNNVEGKEDFYDVLDVASLLYNSGEKDVSEQLLEPGFKKLEISSDAPFGATLYLYCKYTTMGR